MDPTPFAKLVFVVLLGPVAALYDFATNPNAPPQIFAAQWNASFINHQIDPTPLTPNKAVYRPVHKKVTVTHG
jgi:hypothetical protein